MVGRVRNGETPPFRPRVAAGSSVEAVDSRLVDLMQQCWLEDPSHRPTVGAVLARFTDITQIQSVPCHYKVAVHRYISQGAVPKNGYA